MTRGYKERTSPYLIGMKITNLRAQDELHAVFQNSFNTCRNFVPEVVAGRSGSKGRNSMTCKPFCCVSVFQYFDICS